MNAEATSEVHPAGMPARLCALALLLILPLPASAQEPEEILRYDVVVELHHGGRMVVTEEIAVRALGQEIQRGICRDFPTDFPRASGFGRIQAPFQVLSVERDGRAERWSVESIGGPGGRGGVRVRIGDPDVLLDPGEHPYTLRYETWRWVRFGEAEDQLYGSVTGNGWSFPILEASARIVLPSPADPSDVGVEAWTGPEGSTVSDADAAWDGETSTVRVPTRSRLDAGDGLTVRVTFQKGVVAPPTPEVENSWFRLDWGGYVDGATVGGLVLALYVLMWSRVGRDPHRRPLVVRYEPPQRFSPAALGYLQERGYRGSLFAASLVSLGVKGALRIEQKKAWRAALSGRGVGEWFGALFLSVFSLPFIGAEIAVLYILATRVPRHLLVAAVVLGLLNVAFYHLLERPTLKGRGGARPAAAPRPTPAPSPGITAARSPTWGAWRRRWGAGSPARCRLRPAPHPAGAGGAGEEAGDLPPRRRDALPFRQPIGYHFASASRTPHPTRPSRSPSMATYTCPKCGMSVNMTCAKCGKELVNDTITTATGVKVQVSQCPDGHGKIKSPQCCGEDMSCSI